MLLQLWNKLVAIMKAPQSLGSAVFKQGRRERARKNKQIDLLIEAHKNQKRRLCKEGRY